MLQTIDLGSITKISVTIVGPEVNGTYLVAALMYEEGSKQIAIPNIVLSGEEALELDVSNLYRQPLPWKVLMSLSGQSSVSPETAQVCQGGTDEGNLDFFQVDVDDINPGELA